MTMEEQRLADDRMRAEIAKLTAEVEKIRVDVQKAAIDMRYVWMQTIVAPFTAAAVVMGATAALVKLFFG